MSAMADLVYEKIKNLPPQRLAEVADFVDFLQVRDEKLRTAASTRLGDAMAKLDALNLTPLSADEIRAEIKAARETPRPHADRR
jgi:hypothetical protein